MSDRYYVIGHPVAHSKSPDIHAAFARATGQDLVYDRCLAPLDDFRGTVAALIAGGCKGANVTVPFKLEAAQLAEHLSTRARAAGAVNTLDFVDGRIEGDNTDGAGLVNDIMRNAGFSLTGKRVLLLGAGGAARGAILPLLAQGLSALTIANRTLATAQELAARFNHGADRNDRDEPLGHGVAVMACEFQHLDGPYDLVVNATSASLSAAMPPIPPQVFTAATLALDMMYGSQPTPFMTFASASGATARDGLGMLVEQAAEAFFIWRGVRPATAGVLEQMRSSV